MADFTDPNTFLDFFGSFWNRFFPDQPVIRGIASGDAHTITQLYQELVEAVNAISIHTISPFHRESVYPITLRRSTFSQGPDLLTFGNGSVFGAQPPNGKFFEGATFQYGGLERRSGLYYVGIPDKIREMGACLINSLIDPSVMLVRDSDFIVRDDIVIFRTNPFDNPLIAKRKISSADGNSEEDEIILWATNVSVDRNELWTQYGFAVPDLRQNTLTAPAARRYLEALRAVYNVRAGGPTSRMLDSLVASLVGAPVSRHGGEIVQSIESFSGNTLVITDVEVYRVPDTLEIRPEIKVGVELWAGQPLTTTTQVFDRTVQSNWWTDMPALFVGRDFLMADITSALGFLNESSPVDVGIVETASDGSAGRTGRFYLAGVPGDVEQFWSGVRQRGLSGLGFFGDQLYRKFSVVDGNGELDFTQDLLVNPLQLLATDLLADSIIPVKIKVSTATQAALFSDGLHILHDVVPAHLSLLILMDVTVQDEFALVRPDGDSVVTTPLSSTRALVLSDTSLLPSASKAQWTELDDQGVPTVRIPEALSADVSPDILRETLDLGDAANNSDSYGGATKVCEESITPTLQPICTP